ncbi:MAG: HEPN domain-containing protein [Desulfomonilaceae bacterium]
MRVRGRVPIAVQGEAVGPPADPVLVYFRHGYVGEASKAPEHVFRFPQVRPRLEQLLNGWLSNCELLGIAHNLCAHSFYEENIALEARFLFVCHGLESFHRAVKRDEYVDSSEYEMIKKSMIDAISPAIIDPLRRKLTAVLRWANEYSFRKRIDDLIKSLDGECFELIVVQRERFRDQITDTRNRLTHNDPSFSGKFVEGEDLYWLYVRARAMLVVLLLNEAGLPLQLAAEAIKNTWHLKRWLSNARLHA